MEDSKPLDTDLRLPPTDRIVVIGDDRRGEDDACGRDCAGVGDAALRVGLLPVSPELG